MEKFNANLFNYANLLSVSNGNVINISKKDFTLDELKDFVSFMEVMNKAYNHDNKDVREEISFFRYMAEDYERFMDTVPLAILESGSDEWIDEQFLSLKIQAADIACELVLHGNSDFFSDIRA